MIIYFCILLDQSSQATAVFDSFWTASSETAAFCADSFNAPPGSQKSSGPEGELTLAPGLAFNKPYSTVTPLGSPSNLGYNTFLKGPFSQDILQGQIDPMGRCLSLLWVSVTPFNLESSDQIGFHLHDEFHILLPPRVGYQASKWLNKAGLDDLTYLP